PQEPTGSPGEPPEAAGEESWDLDLPEDFDLESLAAGGEEEAPPGLFGPGEEEAAPEAGEEAPPGEVAPGEEFSFEEDVADLLEGTGLAGEPEEAAGEPLPGEAEEGKAPEPEGADFEDIELPDLDLEGEDLGPMSGEEIARIAAEAEAAEEEQLREEEAPGEREEALPGEEAAAGGEPEIELTDEDIALVVGKLKQLSPALASRIRDAVLHRSLPTAVLNDVLAMLIQDQPEDEITGYLGRSGVQVAPAPGAERVLRVERRVGPVERVVQNLAPLVRVAGLAAVVALILGALFWLFVYTPLDARRYYQEGLELIQRERYEPAEERFQQGYKRYPRTGFRVKWYNEFGWQYMLAGHYESARRKFREGIQLELKETYKGVKAEELKEILENPSHPRLDIDNLDIRVNLARLHNILGEYDLADLIYRQLVRNAPRYEHVRLQGLNLIDWGKSGKDEKLDEAAGLFSEAFERDSRNPDPLVRLLDIRVFRGNLERAQQIHQYLKVRFPREVDREVYTSLATLYIDREVFGEVRDLLYRVLEAFPRYAPASYAFSRYYQAVGNTDLQEGFLLQAIEHETDRVLEFPWEQRDRRLLSRSYTDLGSIYAARETPGMAAEAIRYFKKAIDEDGDNAEAYFNLAQVYFYRENNYQQAGRNYRLAQDRGHDTPDLHYNLGLIHFYQKNFGEALKRWSRLEEELPGNPYLLGAMGSALLYLGRYEAALGELLVLSEIYDQLVSDLGEIRPWSARHQRILRESAVVYNNLGVAYQKLAEKTGNPDYERDSLVALYRAGELADVIGESRGRIQYNLNYILHPEVFRGDMAIHDSLSANYRFTYQ
ncbi:MAG: tetratricopeptide repeat protein, partial [Spirochaetota bacterium]